MPLLTLDEIFLEFGDQTIFKGVNLTIEKNERISLIGRNGAGKSTLFGVISGAIQPDSGEVRHRPDLRISELKQTLPRELEKTVQEYVGEGLTDLQELIRTYEKLSNSKPGQGKLREMETLQHQIEEQGGWNIENRIAAILTELELPAEKKLRELSGGWQRRVSLARALINSPELLLLDEPTNHLDLSTIQWLENKTCAFQGSVLFVTHDRAFLQRLATRILELDRGRLNNWPYDYRRFLTEKEKALETEARHHALFDKKLEQEENWIRQGIKARRTRNEGRVRALKKMREEYANREKRQDRARISIEDADASGKKVIEARNIAHGFADHELIKNLSLKIQRGDRIGLIGNNGVGKSTLLKILLGEITPKKGSVKPGSNLEVAYFDQDRTVLDPEKTIAEIIGDGSDYIRINGKERHVVGYLKGFLFSPKRAMTKIKVLSGGECNRVILAKLFSMPSNLLVLDEPTNDLDVETLEVLEEKLCEYAGTLIVVSHDREFLDNVVTSTLVFEAGGTVQIYAGGYSDWLLQGHKLEVTDDPNKKNNKLNKAGKQKQNAGNKLSYKLKLELDQLPKKIESLERRVDELHKQSTAPGFFSQPYQQTKSVLDELAENERNLEQAIERWSELEQLQENLKNRTSKE